MGLTDRQKLLVYAALCYAQANVDDLNDTFAQSDDDDLNEAGVVKVGGVVTSGFDSDEFMDVITKFT